MNDNMNFSALSSSEAMAPIPETAEPLDPEEFLNTIPDYDDNFTIEMIIQKILTSDKQYDLSKIISAYEFAAKAHEGQKRSSGQAYIIHPLVKYNEWFLSKFEKLQDGNLQAYLKYALIFLAIALIPVILGSIVL